MSHPDSAHLYADEGPEDVMTPDLEEVQQDERVPEQAIEAVPVHIDGPVRVNRVPNRAVTMRTLTIPAGTPQTLAGRDLRRARAVLLSTDNPFILAGDRQGCSAGTGLTWPNGQPLTMEHSEPIWVMPTGVNPVTLSVLIERWAD